MSSNHLLNKEKKRVFSTALGVKFAAAAVSPADYSFDH